VLPGKQEAHFLVVGQLTNREIISWALFSTKFLIERAPSWLILVFWDFGRIMAIGPMEHRGSKFGSMSFFNISIKFLIDRVPSCRKFQFWDIGIGSRPQAQMTMSPIQKTFLVLRSFERALICSILIAGTQVMLRKAYFFRRGSWLRPESWTPRPWIENSGPYY
jgi:hypothetical protein